MRVTGDQRVVVVPLNRRGISPLEFINQEMFAANNPVASNGLPPCDQVSENKIYFSQQRSRFCWSKLDSTACKFRISKRHERNCNAISSLAALSWCA
jgi:hypothetical protein